MEVWAPGWNKVKRTFVLSAKEKQMHKDLRAGWTSTERYMEVESSQSSLTQMVSFIMRGFLFFTEKKKMLEII